MAIQAGNRAQTGNRLFEGGWPPGGALILGRFMRPPDAKPAMPAGLLGFGF